MRNNKKGNFVDVPYFIVLAIGFVFVSVIAFMLLSKFNDSIQSNPSINGTTGAMTVSANAVTAFVPALDWVIPIVFVVFIAFSVWSSSFIPSSNKFLVVGVLLTFLLTFFSLMVENFWNEFKTNSTILPYTTGFHFSVFFMDYLRYFVLFYCFIIMIFLYSRRE